MPDTTILLIRHADVHNPDQIVYGRLPRFRLSTDGLAQAKKTAQTLADEPIAAFYTSPMLRARQTTRILAQPHPGVPIHVSQLLAEVLTSYQGTRWSDLAPDANLYEPLKDPGDESMQDIAERMERLIRRLVQRRHGETVACVSHADPIMIARVHLLGLEVNLENIRQPDYPERASVSRLVFHEDGSVHAAYESPAQELIKPSEAAKEEAPAEASGGTTTEVNAAT